MLISFGSGDSEDPENPVTGEEDSGGGDMNLVITIILAMITGCITTLDTVNVKWIIDSKTPVEQAAFDGCFILFFTFLPFFIIEYNSDENAYTS